MIPSEGGGIYTSTSFDGKSKMGLNDGDWHPLDLYLDIGTGSWESMVSVSLITTFESGVSTSTTDSYYYKNVRVYNLTKIFGAGNEPSQSWCRENLVYGGFV
jgi:hypothetical protein